MDWASSTALQLVDDGISRNVFIYSQSAFNAFCESNSMDFFFLRGVLVPFFGRWSGEQKIRHLTSSVSSCSERITSYLKSASTVSPEECNSWETFRSSKGSGLWAGVYRDWNVEIWVTSQSTTLSDCWLNTFGLGCLGRLWYSRWAQSPIAV